MDRQDEMVNIVCRRTVRFKAWDNRTNRIEDQLNPTTRPEWFAIVQPLRGAEEFDGDDLFRVLDNLPQLERGGHPH